MVVDLHIQNQHLVKSQEKCFTVKISKPKARSSINPLPNGKIFNWRKLKTLADINS